MKRNISIIFLLCLVLPLVGTYAFLELEKKKVKREVKWKMIEGLEKEELAQLTFHKKDLKSSLEWKHSREFKFEGEMYDIVCTEEDGDSIHYFCWWDFKETKLNKELASLLDEFIGNKPINKERKEKVSSFYSKLFFSQTKHQELLFSNNKKVDTAFCEAMPIRYNSPNSPPPENTFLYI